MKRSVLSLCTAVLLGAFVALSTAHAASQAENECKSYGLSDRVLAACTKVIQDPHASVAARAQAFSDRASLYRLKDDFGKAIEDYSEAIKLDPTYSTLYFFRANTYKSQEDYDHAIADYSQAMEISKLKPQTPTNEYSYIQLYKERAEVYMDKGDLESAIADWTELIRRDTVFNYYAYYNRAKTYLRKNDYDHAIEDYTRMLGLDSSDLIPAVVYKYRGDAYSAKGDKEKAIADYRAGLATDPKNLRLKNALKRLGVE